MTRVSCSIDTYETRCSRRATRPASLRVSLMTASHQRVAFAIRITSRLPWPLIQPAFLNPGSRSTGFSLSDSFAADRIGTASGDAGSARAGAGLGVASIGDDRGGKVGLPDLPFRSAAKAATTL